VTGGFDWFGYGIPCNLEHNTIHTRGAWWISRFIFALAAPATESTQDAMNWIKYIVLIVAVIATAAEALRGEAQKEAKSCKTKFDCRSDQHCKNKICVN